MAIDGTRIKAVNNKDKNFYKGITEGTHRHSRQESQ